jgi:acyl-coenzyme A thioesterase PaaI-like protein
MTYFNQRLALEWNDALHAVVLDAGDEHLVSPGTVHFAVLTTMAEVAAAAAVGAPVVPAAVHVSLLSRARPGRLTARGTLVKRGRMLAVAQGAVYQDDRVVAQATVTFAVQAA